ncbi:hypothetical protein BOX15_Mlig033379g2 [Macrostomum lignano]|uniref:Uncharacterized protein n=1 Tax=Macrostomum lignano TaxID=282301 RepID=A0A267ENU2_9PLAT|nr:hypothetical protein BOX15_Mlig033379g2 [Macrostomum lignano]
MNPTSPRSKSLARGALPQKRPQSGQASVTSSPARNSPSMVAARPVGIGSVQKSAGSPGVRDLRRRALQNFKLGKSRAPVPVAPAAVAPADDSAASAGRTGSETVGLNDEKEQQQQQPNDSAIFWHEMSRTSEMLTSALEDETRRMRAGSGNEDRQTGGSMATVVELRNLLSEVEKLKQIQRQRQQQQQQQKPPPPPQQQQQQQQQQQPQTQQQKQQPQQQHQEDEQQQLKQFLNLTTDSQHVVSVEINRILRVLDALQRRGLQHHVALSAAEILSLRDSIRRMNPSALSCADIELLSNARELVACVGGKLAEQLRQRQQQQPQQKQKQHQHQQQASVRSLDRLPQMEARQQQQRSNLLQPIHQLKANYQAKSNQSLRGYASSTQQRIIQVIDRSKTEKFKA